MCRNDSRGACRRGWRQLSFLCGSHLCVASPTDFERHGVSVDGVWFRRVVWPVVPSGGTPGNAQVSDFTPQSYRNEPPDSSEMSSLAAIRRCVAAPWCDSGRSGLRDSDSGAASAQRQPVAHSDHQRFDRSRGHSRCSNGGHVGCPIFARSNMPALRSSMPRCRPYTTSAAPTTP